MSWQLAISLAILIGVARLIITRRYAQKSALPANIPPLISYLFGVLPVGIFAALVLFPHEIHWHSTMIILMVVLSVSMALSNWMGFIIMRKLAIAPGQTIGMLSYVGVVLLSWTLLGEGLTVQQFVGGGVLLTAALLAIWAPTKTKLGDFKRISTRTLLIAIASAVLLSIGLVTEKKLLEYTDIGGIFLVSWPIQTLGMLLLATKDIRRSTLQKLNASELRNSTLIGLANGLNGVLYIYAIYHANNISLVTILGTVSFPLTILAAYLFLREREHHRIMWLSLGIACAGLIIVSVQL